MPQVCTICKVLKDESEFNQIKRNNEVRLAKSCRESNSKKSEEKRKALESTYQHLWIWEDGSKIKDLLEVVDDHKRDTCHKCGKEKSVKWFVIYGSKYNPKLSTVCKICNNCCRLENERRKRGEFKEEWYWNRHLIRRYRWGTCLVKTSDVIIFCIDKMTTLKWPTFCPQNLTLALMV